MIGGDGRAPVINNKGMVRLLLARGDLNPDKLDNDGITPLQFDSTEGHEGVVRLLLARDDVDPDKPGRYGGTVRVLGCGVW